jgi:hypothetical protein
VAKKRVLKRDEPILDASKPAVRKLIRLANSRRWVTFDEINAVLPSEEVTAEQIDDVMAFFSELNVDVIEGPPESYPGGWVSKKGIIQLIDNHYQRAILADIMIAHEIGYIAAGIRRWNER